VKFEFWIRNPALKAIEVYDTENAFAKINLFLCFNMSKVPQNFVQV